jgi:hypothetical protein
MKTFEAKIIISVKAETLAEGLQKAKQKAKETGFEVIDVKPVKSVRTLKQNSALHLFFTLLADELNEKHFDMRHLIRREVELSWTPYSVKEYLWRPLQKALLGKKSTTQLDKIKDIDIIYDHLNRIITERTNGEVDFPAFPSIESAIDNL